jgi:hypothetical protein
MRQQRGLCRRGFVDLELSDSAVAGAKKLGHLMRLAAQGPRWEAQDVGFHRSPQVPWE